MADLDAEFARFAAELASVEEATKTAGPEAPSATKPPPSAATSTTPAAAPRAAATLSAAPQPSSTAAAAPHQTHFPLPSAPPPFMPPTHAPPAFAPPTGPPPMPPAYQAAAPQYYDHSMAADGYGHMAAPMRSVPPVLVPPAPSADILQKLKADLMKQERQTNPKVKNLASSKALAAKAASSSGKGVVRQAAGKRWFDPTLGEWPDNDFRIFVGDIGNEVQDETLAKAFQKYPSFAKAKVVRCGRTNKTKGYGFVSFLDSADMVKALKEMNGKYIGNRPCKLSRSSWDERSAPVKRKGGEQGGGQHKRR